MKTNIVVSAVRVNGYWYLRVKYDENNCRVRYQQSTGLKIDQSYRKVEQARRRVLAELYEINRMDEQCEKWDISPELRYQPVSEWLKRWLDDCRESIAESTLVRYTAVVRHACQFFDEKGLALCRVSPMAMEEYRDAMLAYGYSARTIQMHFKLLQTAFTSACSCGLNRSNPICGVPNHFPNVSEPSLKSTATSNTSPLTTRTSLSCGWLIWKCNPLNTPFFDADWLSCTNWQSIPASLKSL